MGTRVPDRARQPRPARHAGPLPVLAEPRRVHDVALRASVLGVAALRQPALAAGHRRGRGRGGRLHLDVRDRPQARRAVRAVAGRRRAPPARHQPVDLVGHLVRLPLRDHRHRVHRPAGLGHGQRPPPGLVLGAAPARLRGRDGHVPGRDRPRRPAGRPGHAPPRGRPGLHRAGGGPVHHAHPRQPRVGPRPAGLRLPRDPGREGHRSRAHVKAGAGDRHPPAPGPDRALGQARGPVGQPGAVRAGRPGVPGPAAAHPGGGAGEQPVPWRPVRRAAVPEHAHLRVHAGGVGRGALLAHPPAPLGGPDRHRPGGRPGHRVGHGVGGPHVQLSGSGSRPRRPRRWPGSSRSSPARPR